MTSVAILGITGRMGRALFQALMESRDLKLGGALASPKSSSLGQDAGQLFGGGPVGVEISADLDKVLAKAQVVIDFTVHAAVLANLEACVRHRRPLVIGTTGLSADTLEKLRAASAQIPILMSPNMSVGVNLLCRLAELATGILGEDFDAEILEIHHRQKLDAPSGTALRIGESVAKARGVNLTDVAALDRNGRRRKGQIGFAVSRGGDAVGEHTLMLLGNGESLALTHKATDRLTFARGALRAADWLASRGPGLYSMNDVLAVDTPQPVS